ncbi:hypothetical protein DERP_002595 [Dermatophagoides pteronyssinus]|uniref:Transmembrane protein 234 homolog n=1 Tax=Dermatophagoides pteronyssinus TaxID=6956 RepID=A0ABQ8JIN0_DERPT|nr:hypothetical protein DERP_002595 [Dermatophagoides pteronyssinus]
MLNDHLFGYILTISSGILWGLSTPFMKQSFDWNDSISSSENILSSLWPIIKLLISNWKFIIFFLLNQLGSILYTCSLSYTPINLAVPLSNSINLILVFIFDSWFFKENIIINTGMVY